MNYVQILRMTDRQSSSPARTPSEVLRFLECSARNAGVRPHGWLRQLAMAAMMDFDARVLPERSNVLDFLRRARERNAALAAESDRVISSIIEEHTRPQSVGEWIEAKERNEGSSEACNAENESPAVSELREARLDELESMASHPFQENFQSEYESHSTSHQAD